MSLNKSTPLSLETAKRIALLDLHPAVNFIDKQRAKYCLSEDALFRGSERASAPDRGFYKNVSQLRTPQLHPSEISAILQQSYLPSTLLRLSALTHVDYRYADQVPVPSFQADGSLDTSNIKLVPVEKFPRAGDHPTIILIGYTSEDGTIICPTALPHSVTRKEKVGWYYQLHVFLHEFMHTVLSPRKTSAEREKVVCTFMDKHFTLEEWWQEWVSLFTSLPPTEPLFVSSYAEYYADSLREETMRKELALFNQALAEQICESFSAYMLDICPNDRGWTSFREESFGNDRLRMKFEEGQAEGANLKWNLMHKLCASRLS